MCVCICFSCGTFTFKGTFFLKSIQLFLNFHLCFETHMCIKWKFTYWRGVTFFRRVLYLRPNAKVNYIEFIFNKYIILNSDYLISESVMQTYFGACTFLYLRLLSSYAHAPACCDAVISTSVLKEYLPLLYLCFLNIFFLWKTNHKLII